jgi:hypothetical protein
MGKVKMNILDHISKSLETIFFVKILKCLDPGISFGPGSGMEKNSDLGLGINIPG